MAASEGQHRGSRLKPLPAAVAGVMVGALIVALLAANDIPSHAHEEATVPAEGPGAASAFLDAWHRSRSSSWSVVSRFTRSGPEGEQLAVEVRRAQRPPDRLLVGLGSVTARRGDVELVCSAGEGGSTSLHCREGKALASYDDEVAAELAVLRTYVLGPDALYAVREERPSCFRLRLRFDLPSPPYGRLAIFCFDDETGAPVLAEIRRDEGNDLTRALRVDADPGPEDLAPPPTEPAAT